MNEENTCTGENRDWTNPSKCLVDKALEQWSTTRMRADNTSVVIIMIDPPGPPKRDVLKVCPQQLIVEQVDDENILVQFQSAAAAADICDVEKSEKNVTMFDHSTKETVDLDFTPPMPTSGLAIMTRYDELPSSVAGSAVNDCHAINIKNDYAFATTSSNTDISFMDTLTESYNSILHSPVIDPLNSFLYHDESTDSESVVVPHTLSTAGQNDDDTYSLTRLETHGEHHFNTNTLNNESSSSILLPFREIHRSNQYSVTERHQYDSISSSFLSQSCGIMQSTLDDSVQAALMNNACSPVNETNTYNTNPNYINVIDELDDDDDDEDFEPTDINKYEKDFCLEQQQVPIMYDYLDTNELYSTSSNDFCNPSGRLIEDIREDKEQVIDDPIAAELCLVVPDVSNLSENETLRSTEDETIQIHEISSSSKDNEEKICINCAPRLRSNNITTESSRTTRSAKKHRQIEHVINANRSSRITKSNTSTQQKVRTLRTTTITKLNASKIVQNENVPSRCSTRRMQEIQVDTSKRTLRSKNLVNVKQIKSSASSLAAAAAVPSTSSFAAETTLSTRKNKTKIQQMVSTTILKQQILPRQLREKLKSNELIVVSQVKPKLIKNNSTTTTSSSVSKKIHSKIVNATNNCNVVTTTKRGLNKRLRR